MTAIYKHKRVSALATVVALTASSVSLAMAQGYPPQQSPWQMPQQSSSGFAPPYQGYRPQAPMQPSNGAQRFNVNPALEQLIPQFGQPLPQVPPSMAAPMAPGPGWGTGTAGQAPMQTPMSPQEQRVARLEQAAFGSTYPEHEVDDRVEHLEREVFGKSDGGDLESRLAHLEGKLGGGAFGGKPTAPPVAQSTPMPPTAPPAWKPANGATTSPPPPPQFAQQPPQFAPMQQMPIQQMPMQTQQPPQFPPMQQMAMQPPQQFAPMQQMPVQQMPMQAPPQFAPMQQMPMQAQPQFPPMNQMPMQQMPMQQMQPPAQFAPMQQQMPVQTQQPPQIPAKPPAPEPVVPLRATALPAKGTKAAKAIKKPADKKSENTIVAQAPTNLPPPPVAPVAVPAAMPPAPSSPEEDRARSEFETAVQSIPFDEKAGDYFQVIANYPGPTYAHWSSFPVRLHVPMNTESHWRIALEQAVHEWSKAIPVMIVPPNEAADIELAWINHLQPKQLGITNLEIFNGRMRVTIYLLRPNYYPAGVPSTMLPTVATHELGHALGVWGHSNVASDVMHPMDTAKPKSALVTARDINTLRRVYTSRGLPSDFQSPQPVGWPFTHYALLRQ